MEEVFNKIEGKKIKIILKSGWYYKGLVLSQGEKYISINDINEKRILISKDQISTLEVLQ